MIHILLTLFYTILTIFLILRIKFFRIEGFTKTPIIAIFIIKILAGVLLFIIYSYYYTDRKTADIFRYFDDSKIMYDAVYKHPLDYVKMVTGIRNDNPYFDTYYIKMNNWHRQYESNIYNDNHTIIRINALLRILSFGYYNVHTVFFCFLSLIGLTALFKFFMNYMRDKKTELFIAVFLLPSVIFWGSGVLKEGILLLGLGLLLYFFNLLIYGDYSFKNLVIILFSLCLLYYTKVYVLITIIPLLAAHTLIVKTGTRFTELKYIAVLTIFGFIGLNINKFFPDYNILQMLADKQKDFINLAHYMKSGSIIDMKELQPTILSIIENSPHAFYITMFRPFIFESLSPFFVLAGIENLLILLLLVAVLVFIKVKRLNRDIFYFSLLFVIFTFILTGLITPVLGAVVRYKVPALPFLAIVLVMLIDKEKLIKKFF